MDNLLMTRHAYHHMHRHPLQTPQNYWKAVLAVPIVPTNIDNLSYTITSLGSRLLHSKTLPASQGHTELPTTASSL